MYLTIHRGTHEIGGSCVEISTATTRIIIDVGLPLDERNENIIPNVPGLFSDGTKINAILLSHAHADHCGLLNIAKPEIPVYLSKGTSKMLLAGSIFAGQAGSQKRKSIELEPRKTCFIGDIKITPYAVDHSAFDSLALLIEADGKRILYSGDLRLHGRKPGMARGLIRASSKAPLDCLIMEGTNFVKGRPIGLSEHELEEFLFGEIYPMPDLVLAAFSPMHVDRLVTFYKAARRLGRTFVVDAYAAFVLHLVSGQAKIPRPTRRNGIRVYYNASFVRNRRRFKKIYDLFQADRIELDFILAEPKEHLMLFRPSMTKLDFHGQLPANVRCFYSYWHGYLQKPEWKECHKQLLEVGGDLIEAHTSGHIFSEHIVELVSELRPRSVVPIHTAAPEEFAKHFDNVLLANDGVPIAL